MNNYLYVYFDIVGNDIHPTPINDEWGDAIAGDDGFIYWPPLDLKFDPETNHKSLVGDDFGEGYWKWNNGALAPDGAIYSIPSGATQVLSMDPIEEFQIKLKAGMENYPEKVGLLFDTNNAGKTNYECAMIKFGEERLLQSIENSIPLLGEICDSTKL